ncbi:MAG: MBOAT family O-acyltransferase [Lachnospiraceae bacterium]|nr:MBOAT family O-acyltransferase [Lachnospiraceae bacterium]
MVFSSITFLFLFLPIVLMAYFFLPGRFRNFILLIASLFFYAWGEPVYIVLMVLSIAFNYICGLEINAQTDPKKKRIKLAIAVAADLSVLVLFKYCTFLQLSLPIGISFYTFQAISYIVDVYRGKAPVQKNALNFALYISMFPQLIAGPIVRYADINQQLDNRSISSAEFGAGMRRFLLGLAKKVILANGLGAVFASVTADSASGMATASAWIGLLAYTLQIYFDFSGYSDMAIGLGRMFGFHFNENFRLPYTAESITDFWRKWHISLGSWFREYVYIPLGGNRNGAARQILNLLIVWCLTGIWHGASSNFMFWGLYYGILLILEKFIWGKAVAKLPKILRHVYALFFIILGWTLFFSSSLGEAVTYLGYLFGVGSTGLTDAGTASAIMYQLPLWIIGIFACTGTCKGLLDRAEQSKKAAMAVNAAYIAVFIIAISCLITDSYNPFLYFRF